MDLNTVLPDLLNYFPHKLFTLIGVKNKNSIELKVEAGVLFCCRYYYRISMQNDILLKNHKSLAHPEEYFVFSLRFHSYDWSNTTF